MDKMKASEVKKILSEFIGTNPDDIETEDNLAEDLHMQPSDLSDFLQALDDNGFDVSKIDLTEIETVNDLFESLDID